MILNYYPHSKYSTPQNDVWDAVERVWLSNTEKVEQVHFYIKVFIDCEDGHNKSDWIICTFASKFTF